MFLVANDTLEMLMDASVQGTEGKTVLAGGGAGGDRRTGGLGRCHCKDRDR